MGKHDWMDRAECVTRKPDPDLFMDNQSSKTRFSREQLRLAKWYCQQCPVTKECAEYGNGYAGVYAGKYTGTKKALEMRVVGDGE